ncbi:MAG: energy transducer TonB [Candidatus Sulfotelmatobacter sp.]
MATPVAARTRGALHRKIINKVEPVYPELAKHMNIGGTVKVEVVIRPNGSVKSTKIVGGSPVLLDSAKEAVLKWKFAPSPEETTEVVEVSFVSP